MLGAVEAALETAHTSSADAVAAGDIHVGGGGVGALAAALGPGHPKLCCFALVSLMDMWCW